MPVVFLTSVSTSPWPVAGDWTDAGQGIELLGCGSQASAPTAQGVANAVGGSGGGGGAYTQLVYSSGTAVPSVAFQVQTNTTPIRDNTTNATCWENSSYANCYAAQCGTNQQGSNGAGGAIGTSTGTPPGPIYTAGSRFAGGSATFLSNAFYGGCAGAGAAGPSAAGGAGGAGGAGVGFGGGGGGAANNGATGAGVAATTASGGNGGPGVGATHGAGLGSTSATAANGSAGAGGQGGGGGCGSTATTGTLTASGYAGGTLGNIADWIQTVGSTHAGAGAGGGAGGALSGAGGTQTSNGGNGADYGGGGGGRGPCRNTGFTATSGTGGGGLVVITYTHGPWRGSSQFNPGGNFTQAARQRMAASGLLPAAGAFSQNAWTETVFAETLSTAAINRTDYYCVRQQIYYYVTVQQWSAAGTATRIRFQTMTTAPAGVPNLRSMYIGQLDPASPTGSVNFLSAPVGVTFNGSGSILNIQPNTIYISDPIPFIPDFVHDVLIAYYMDSDVDMSCYPATNLATGQGNLYWSTTTHSDSSSQIAPFPGTWNENAGNTYGIAAIVQMPTRPPATWPLAGLLAPAGALFGDSQDVAAQIWQDGSLLPGAGSLAAAAVPFFFDPQLVLQSGTGALSAGAAQLLAASATPFAAAGGFAGAAIYQIRVCHQPQDRKSAWRQNFR
jgi:hypothetical protein